MTYLIFTNSDASELDIGEQWRLTPEYKQYIELGWENSESAKKIKEDSITKLTRQALNIYIHSFDKKYQEVMDRKVNELSLGMQILLSDINIDLRTKLSQKYDIGTIWRFNLYIFNYVDSIYKWKGTATKNLNDLIMKFPELNWNEVIEQLKILWKNSDEWAKWDELNKQLKEIWEQIKKM